MNAVIRLAIPLMQYIGRHRRCRSSTADELTREVTAGGFSIIDRTRHGSGRTDFRVFLAARKPGP